MHPCGVFSLGHLPSIFDSKPLSWSKWGCQLQQFMKRKLITFLLSIAFIVLLAAVIIGYEYLKPPPVVRGSTESLQGYLVNSFQDAAEEKRLGCAGLVLVEDRQISLTRCFGRRSEERRVGKEGIAGWERREQQDDESAE